MVGLKFPENCKIKNTENAGVVVEYFVSGYGRKLRVLYDEFLYKVIIIVDDDERHVYRRDKIGLANSFLRRFFDKAMQDYEKQKKAVKNAFNEQMGLTESNVMNELNKIMGIK